VTLPTGGAARPAALPARWSPARGSLLLCWAPAQTVALPARCPLLVAW